MSEKNDGNEDESQRQEAIEASGRELAREIDGALNPGYDPATRTGKREVGFALLLFYFGEPPQPATYLSNGPREDMIGAIEEWLARVKR